MIESKEALKHYIDCDLRSRGIDSISLGKKILAHFLPAPWMYQVMLRKAEYYNNSNSTFLKMWGGVLEVPSV